jgi:hypothetical protein
MTKGGVAPLMAYTIDDVLHSFSPSDSTSIMDFVTDDVLVAIFSLLEVEVAMVLASVCKRWQRAYRSLPSEYWERRLTSLRQLESVKYLEKVHEIRRPVDKHVRWLLRKLYRGAISDFYSRLDVYGTPGVLTRVKELMELWFEEHFYVVNYTTVWSFYIQDCCFHPRGIGAAYHDSAVKTKIESMRVGLRYFVFDNGSYKECWR